MKNSRVIKSKKFVQIVTGNAPVKSDEAWKRMQDRAKGRAFPNRTAAKLSR